MFDFSTSSSSSTQNDIRQGQDKLFFHIEPGWNKCILNDFYWRGLSLPFGSVDSNEVDASESNYQTFVEPKRKLHTTKKKKMGDQ